MAVTNKKNTEEFNGPCTEQKEGQASTFTNRSVKLSGSQSLSLSSSSRSSSSSSLPSDYSLSDAFGLPPAPDGGWGWLVVLGAFFLSMIIDGCGFSFGVMFVHLLNEFKKSKSETSWVASIFYCVALGLGPVASALTARFGFRTMTIVAGVISCLGFVASSFATSVWMLYITYGIIVGSGFSICYVTSVLVVAYYFDKRRALATGLAVCGSGVGTFVFAPMCEFLVDIYGWRGTFLIMGGISLNLCVCGSLFRPIELTPEQRRERALRAFNRITRNVSRLSIPSRRSRHHSTESYTSSAESEFEEEPALQSFSQITIPTFANADNEKIRLYLEMLPEIRKNAIDPQLALQRFFKSKTANSTCKRSQDGDDSSGTESGKAQKSKTDGRLDDETEIIPNKMKKKRKGWNKRKGSLLEITVPPGKQYAHELTDILLKESNIAVKENTGKENLANMKPKPYDSTSNFIQPVGNQEPMLNPAKQLIEDFINKPAENSSNKLRTENNSDANVLCGEADKSHNNQEDADEVFETVPRKMSKVQNHHNLLEKNCNTEGTISNVNMLNGECTQELQKHDQTNSKLKHQNTLENNLTNTSNSGNKKISEGCIAAQEVIEKLFELPTNKFSRQNLKLNGPESKPKFTLPGFDSTVPPADFPLERSLSEKRHNELHKGPVSGPWGAGPLPLVAAGSHQSAAAVQSGSRVGADLGVLLMSKHSTYLLMHRRDIFFRASPRSETLGYCATSCPELSRLPDDAESYDEEICCESCCSCLKGWRRAASSTCDRKVITNPLFIMFAVSNFLLYFWGDIPYVYAADFALARGKTERQATFLISVIGIVNTVGQIFYGFVGDRDWNLTVIYGISCVGSGLAVLLLPTVNAYWLMAVLCGLFGFFVSANYVLMTVMLVEYLGVNKLPSAYGLIMMIQGMANLGGPPVAGFLTDTSGNYELAFPVSGGFIMLSGVILFLLYAVRLCGRLCRSHRRRHARQASNKSNKFELNDNVLWIGVVPTKQEDVV